MLWVPTPRPLVVHAAVLLLPLPLTTTALQPPMVLPSLAKLTLPVGLAPVTVAVIVTFVPVTTGLPDVDSAVVVDGKPEPLALHASTSVISDHPLGLARTLTRMRSVVNGAKVTVRFTRLLPVTVVSGVHAD